MNIKIFLICGEKSGNEIMENILNKLSNQLEEYKDIKNIEIQGVFDKNFEEKFNKNFKIKNILPYQNFSLFGFADILFNLPSLLDKINFVAKKIIDFQPNLIITIDSYELSIKVAKKINKFIKKQSLNNSNTQNNIKLWHIVSPSVWAYFPKRAKKIAKYYNKLFYFFPFEEEYYKPLERKETKYNKGFVSIFTGFQSAFQEKDKNIIKDEKLIGITLGSRIGEIMRHKNLILSTIAKLKIVDDKYKFIIFATKDTYEIVKQHFDNIKNVEIITDNDEKKRNIQKCSVIISKIGTNNIEIGALNTAMITYYTTSCLTSLFIKIFVKIKFFNIYNIVAKKQIIPEFTQKQATSYNLAKTTYFLLTNHYERSIQLKNIKQILNIIKREDGKTPVEIITNEIMEFMYSVL